jgi:23S rRNA (guanosine2251-2'-O)-methyltransferase
MLRREDTHISVFGSRAVLAALASHSVEVRVVRVARGAPTNARSEIEAACKAAGVDCEIVSTQRVREISQDARHDQGVAARIVLNGVIDAETVDAERPSRWLALDGITNAQNAGMIARSAVAAGMDGILWPRTGTPWLNGLVVKASAASVLDCPIARCDALADALEMLRGRGFRVLGLTADGETDLFESTPPEKAIYVIEGLSRPVRGELDERVRIPIAAGVESLNAAIAASLVAFHVCRIPR